MTVKGLKRIVTEYPLEYSVFVREVHAHSTRASSNDIHPCSFKRDQFRAATNDYFDNRLVGRLLFRLID